MGFMKQYDLRLRNGGDDAVAAAGELADALIGENDRLTSLTRFQDRVIRSGNTAVLTEQEREAVQLAVACVPFDWAGQLLRGLLERLK